jgi:PhnB protein
MSRIQLSTYVNFQGRAREAMEFYHEALGGSLDLQTLDERGEPKRAGPGERVMYSRLEADGTVILGSDGHPDYPVKAGENVALALTGTDRDRLTRAFTALADGGMVKGPLTPQSWGAEVGWLTDRFGLNWMVSIDAG